MSKREILITPYGEMMDMIACLSIYDGNAVPKSKKKNKRYTAFDEAIKLR
jgi:hypothetical protein